MRSFVEYWQNTTIIFVSYNSNTKTYINFLNVFFLNVFILGQQLMTEDLGALSPRSALRMLTMMMMMMRMMKTQIRNREVMMMRN